MIKRVWFLSLLLVAGLFWSGGILWGPKPVWIQPGLNQPHIDVGRWIESGIYKRRPSDGYDGLVFSDVSVLRVNPLPVTEADDPALRARIKFALSQERWLTPEVLDKLSSVPAHKRAFYVASGFLGEDQPDDVYEFFVSIAGKRYRFLLSRDGITGRWSFPGNMMRTNDLTSQAIIRRFEALEAADGVR